MIVLVVIVGAMLAIPLLLLVGGLAYFAIRPTSNGPIVNQAVEERAEAVHVAPQPAETPPAGEATQQGAD